MATAQARGEAEQPPLLRVATTLGAGDGGDRRGAGPKPELHWAETVPPPSGRVHAGPAGSCSLEMCSTSLSHLLFLGDILYIERDRQYPNVVQHCLQSGLCQPKMLKDDFCYMNLLQDMCF